MKSDRRLTWRKGKQGRPLLGASVWVSEPCCSERRLQDIESDTGYDTRLGAPEGDLARVSQTAVYDTCLIKNPRRRAEVA